MSEIRFVTSSDEHLADLNPGFRKDDYRGAVLKKLEWQGELAKSVGADALLRGGDFFHIKRANQTTMATMAMVSSIHRRYSCPTYSVAGNHDMSYNDPESIPRQPIGVLFNSKIFRRLRDERFEKGGTRVRVVGVDFTTDLDDEALRDAVRKKDGDTYTIAFVHALASHAPSEKFSSFFSERVFDYRDLVFDGCPDVYVFGHYHKDQGVQEHLGVQFVNVGAVSRGALTFENLERVPKVTSITCNSQGISIDVHNIPCEDASVVFDLELKKQIDHQKKSLGDFISMLRSDSSVASASTKESRIDVVRRSEYPDDLKDLVIETMESAEAGLAEDG